MAAPAAVAKPMPDKAAIAGTAQQAMTATGARGLAIATIDKGKVVSVQAFGERNARGDPLTPQTIMYGASLTKAVFAYSVLRLVDEGKVDLDKPIAAMLGQPAARLWQSRRLWQLGRPGGRRALAGDHPAHGAEPQQRFREFLISSNPTASCASISIRAAATVIRARGSCCSSSGSRQGLGLNVGQGGPAARLRSVGHAELKPRLAPRFRREPCRWLGRSTASVEPHDERGRVRMAGSMDTTITDLANFAAALAVGRGAVSRTARRRTVSVRGWRSNRARSFRRCKATLPPPRSASNTAVHRRAHPFYRAAGRWLFPRRAQ
jgi:hypothetical protein